MHVNTRHYLERALSQIISMIKCQGQDLYYQNLSNFPSSSNIINLKRSIHELRKQDLELDLIQVLWKSMETL